MSGCSKTSCGGDDSVVDSGNSHGELWASHRVFATSFAIPNF
jgi:hypothetical protein